MRPTLSIVVALTALCAEAAEHNRELPIGRDYYLMAEFRKAAERFQTPCNTKNDAEACYWTGLSYERLADTRMPFGCKIDAKARGYFSKAITLAPSILAYRLALFDFLLSTAECSRTALREAEGLLSEMPASAPECDLMSSRLKEERRLNGSVDAHLAKIFLAVPRATDDLAGFTRSVVRNRVVGGAVLAATAPTGR